MVVEQLAELLNGRVVDEVPLLRRRRVPRRGLKGLPERLGRPRVGLIVTTLTGTNRAVVRFYNQRGTAEQWIKEGKAATHWTAMCWLRNSQVYSQTG